MNDNLPPQSVDNLESTQTPADPPNSQSAGIESTPQKSANNIPPAAVKEAVVATMRTVFDPEIPVNIYDLGMVYSVDVAEDGATLVQMTLTSPMCPVAGSLPGEVQAKVASVSGVTSAKVDLVWEPAWHPDMMTEAAKLTLNMM